MSSKRKKQPLDKAAIGFLVGFIVPLLVFLGVWFFGEKGISFSNYVANLWHLQALIKLGSLCVFANLLAFWGFIRMNYDRAARGLLGATIIYAMIILISKAF